MTSILSLHQQLILDHYRNPRNKTPLAHYDLQGTATNPLCGDEVTLQLNLEGETISKVGFEGKGCSISQAAASMLSTHLSGKTLKEAVLFVTRFRTMMDPSTEELDATLMGNLVAFQGVQKFPLKIRCVLVFYEAFQDAIKDRGQQWK